MSAPIALAGTEDHPHARVVLGAALGVGLAVARVPLPRAARHGQARGRARASRRSCSRRARPTRTPSAAACSTGTHPDLTWVAPTGAHVMRVDDVEEPVVAAATRTPFEASRRVFVLERVDTMNDEVANRLLKTLEEPAAYVHLILLTERARPRARHGRLALSARPLRPAARGADRAALEADGVAPERALACARLALGNGARARFLASEEGEALRAEVEAIVREALARRGRWREPWRALLDRAEAAPRPPRRSASAEERARAARARAEGPRAPLARAEWRRWPSATAGARAPSARPRPRARGARLPRPGLRRRGRREAVLGTRPLADLAADARARDPRRLRRRPSAASRCASRSS